MTTHGRYMGERATDESILRAAGAHVYSREFTLRYMQAELAKRPPGLVTRLAGDIWADNLKFIAALAAAAACVLAFQAEMLALPDMGAGAFAAAEAAAGAAGFIGAYFALDRGWCRPSSVWQTYRLDGSGIYDDHFGTRIVPEFARDLLYDIQQVMPEGTTFAISVLGLDPVLTCTTRNGSYTVLIYDGDAVIRE